MTWELGGNNRDYRVNFIIVLFLHDARMFGMAKLQVKIMIIEFVSKIKLHMWTADVTRNM